MIDNFPDIKSFKLVKLINGEDIICTISDGNPNKSGGFIQVNSPLRMQVLPRLGDGGKITESLNLAHWVHPYTETRQFHIPNSSILLVADVSPGLSRYYEYVLMKIEKEDKFFDEELVPDDEIYDELLEEMDTETDSIH
tara:strand:- start:91 stop:507 length:417 start_codon:yes stop_codon:yes gene_type:complete